MLAFWLVPTRAANACTGTVPHCQPCYAATCSADIPQWHCDVAAAGTACNDSNLCTSSDVCDGNGTCGGTQMSCPISNGSGSCVPTSGTCGYTCNNGYQLSGSTCLVSPANATITLSSTKTTVNTTGLTASVPVQAGATYAWSITGGTITAGQGTATATFTATATPSTTLSVTVTTAASQTASSSATVSVYAAAVATITAPSQVTAGATAIGASVPAQTSATYAWSLTGGTITSGSGTNSIQFTAGSADPITLSITVTNGAGAAQTSSDTIHVYPLPVASITAPSSVTAGTANLSASVPAQTGDTFSWTVTGGTLTSGQGTNTIGFTAGSGASMTVACNVTNQAQTTTSGTKSIAIYPPPNATLSASVSNATAGVGFTASVPSQSGTFVWTIGGTGVSGNITSGAGTSSVTISPSLTGASPSTMTISVSVTNSAGATATSSTIFIPVYAQPNAAVTAPSIVTAGAAGYTASVPAQTGANYAWTATGGSITAGATNSITFTAGASGSVGLSVVVTNGAGTQATGTSSSTITPVPNCAISSPTHVTSGKTGLSASAPAAQLTYSWTATGGTITAGAATSSITYTVGSGSTMTLTCSATNALGANDTETLTLAIVAPPVATVTAPSSAVAGTVFTATVPTQAGSTYAWSFSNAQGVTASVTSGSGTNAVGVTATNTAGTTGSLTITSTVTNAAGDSATSTGSVSVSPAPGPAITAPAFVTVSSSGNSAQTAATASAYSWSITGGTITSGAGTSSIRFSPSGASGSTVQLSLQITTGAGVSVPGTATVQVVPLPQTPVISGSTLVTTGVGGWTASVPANPNMQYQWTVAGGSITSANGASGVAGTGTNSITYTATAAAGASVSISCVEINQAGAQSTAGTFTATAQMAPVTPTITAQAPITSGVGGFAASVTANPAMLYTWTVTGGSITSAGGAQGQSLSGTNQIVYTVTAAAGQMVTISATESNSAGTASSPYTVTLSVIAAPVQPIISLQGGASAVTVGATGLTASVSAHAGMTYWWTISGGSLTNPSGFTGEIAGGSDTITFTIPATAQPGTTLVLTCVEKNAAGTTSSPAQASATIVDAPKTPQIAAPSTADPAAANVVATVVAHAGMTYQWSIDAASTSAAAAIIGAAGGVTSGAVNTITFSAGSGGAVLLSCVEKNAAGTGSSAGVSAPILIGMPSVGDAAEATAQFIPDQAFVGALPGKPATEGGAAAYHIPVEIPPGRAGMQPTISLDYNSRNGNGVVGVGWGLSAGATIYRCPRILDGDGASRTVQHDAGDMLCMGGQRLIRENASVAGYGASGSSYRSEIEQYDRVILTGSYLDPVSTFEVWHKSGRRSVFAARTVGVPDVWYVVRESDPQKNCIAYSYISGTSAARPNNASTVPDPNAEVLLSSISYTGTLDASGCSPDGPNTRTVQFAYTFDRSDMRTTYRYGVPNPMTARLASISVSTVPAPGQTKLTQTVPARTPDNNIVRTYQLTYATSRATQRSLLQSVQLSAGGLTLPSTSFQYQNDSPQYAMKQPLFNLAPAGAQAQWQTLGPDTRLLPTADYDGDGTPDLVILRPGASLLYLSQSNTTIDLNGIFAGVLQLATTDPARNSAMYSNGKALLVGRINGFLGFGSPATNQVFATTYTPPAEATTFKMEDVNGDGMPDLVYYVNSTNQQKFVLGDPAAAAGLPASWTPNPVQVAQNPVDMTSGEMSVTQERDMNGDGILDFIYEQDPLLMSNTNPIAPVASYPVSSAPLAYPTPVAFSQFGGPAQLGGPFAPGHWADVNGDGLLDLFDDQGRLWINLGGPSSAPMFAQKMFTMPTFTAYRALLRSFVMDVDGDGQDELVVPNSRSIAYCGGTDPVQFLPSGDPEFWCGDEFDTALPDTYRDNVDQSVFIYDVYKFHEHADGSYTLDLTPYSPGAPVDPLHPYPALNLQAPINNSSRIPGDITGDGLADVSFRLVVNTGNAYYQGRTASQLGVWVSYNTVGAPDLLVSATDGLASTAKWVHRPLVYSPLAKALGITTPPIDPAIQPYAVPLGYTDFYTLSHDGSQSPGYSFFISSMWTVSIFASSNGTGALNQTSYAYQDAMLSDWGRGFQGFRFITSQEQIANTNGANQNRLSTSEFHQEFPLVGRLKTTTVDMVAGGHVSTTQIWWHQTPNLAATGSWLVYSSGSVDTETDPGLSSTVLSRKTNIVVADASTGEPTTSCSLVENATVLPPASPGGTPTPAHVASVQNSTLAPDTTDWILTLISDRTSKTGFWGSSTTASPLLDPTNAFSSRNCIGLITGTAYRSDSKATTCGAPAPTCTAFAILSAAKQQRTTFTYTVAGDNGFPGKVKEADVVLADGSIEAATTFAYDTFGNALATTMTGRDACAAPVPAPPSAAAACASRTPKITTLTYDASGYFPTARTDPMGKVTAMTFVPETGAPRCVQEVQSVTPLVCKNYDPLGRLTEVTDSSKPTHPQEIRVSACAIGACALKTQTFQTGAPTSTTYADLLQRPLAQGVEGVDGLEVIARTDYNARGQKITEYPPAVSTAGAGGWNGSFGSPYPVNHVFDALGRETSKTVLRDPTLFNGQGDASITTTYTYSVDPVLGLTTTISVPKALAVGGALSMTRSYDGAGHLVRTTQRLAAHDVVASYFYDPMGHVTQIVDPSLNAITTAYDDLGRKISTSDPDKGVSTYTWDGLGRLRTQTDANAITSQYWYDESSRKTNRYVNGGIDATWTYSSTTGAQTNVAGVDGFSRSTQYDALLRPQKVTTHMPAQEWAARDFVEQYAYDGLYARVKAVEYPSGETVRFDYDSQRGFPIGETEIGALGTAGTTYRRVTAFSARGLPTIETLGNGITELAKFDDSLGLAQLTSASSGGVPPVAPPATCAQVPGTTIRCLEYKYDQFSNLAQQTKFFFPLVNDVLSGVQATGTEVYQYDDLQRLLSESRSYTNFVPASMVSETYGYDDAGNILSKSDFGSPYAYGNATRPHGAGPHAVLTVGSPATWSYTYDANGNMLSDGQRTMAYDDQDRPNQITLGGVTTIFRYTPDGDRYLQRTTSAADTTVNRTIYYVDKLYERVDWDRKQAEERTYCSKATVIEQIDGLPRAVRYMHVDRLGSLDAATDVNGVEILTEAHGWDAFGRPRDRQWEPSGDPMHPGGEWGTTTNHGFTGHEQLDETLLTHMNGRVYDYRLGRFLSVDPLISNPASGQAINPYSYIENNPLSGVDPTGYAPAGSPESVGDPASGCGSFSRCDVSFFNFPNSTLADKNGHVIGVVPTDIANALSTSAIGQNTPDAPGQRAGASPAAESTTAASDSPSTLHSAADVGRIVDGWAASVDRSLFSNGERPWLSPLKAPADVLRMLGDVLKLGEGFAVAGDSTQSLGARGLGALQDIGRALTVTLPVLKWLAAAPQATATIKEGIYEFPASSGKTYVGQSGDLMQRLMRHLQNGKLLEEDIDMIKVKEVLGGKTAREVQEQLRINALGGIKNLENKVNPIGPARQYLLRPGLGQ